VTTILKCQSRTKNPNEFLTHLAIVHIKLESHPRHCERSEAICPISAEYFFVFSIYLKVQVE
jgi:hypothetical protein